MTIALVLVLFVPAILWIGLMLYLRRFRHGDSRSKTLDPLELGMRQILDPEMYTAEGRRVLPWVRRARVLLLLALLAALIMVATDAAGTASGDYNATE